MRHNRSIPNAVVIPELAYSDVPAAAKSLCEKFGFRERLRIASHRIQLLLGGGAVVVNERGWAAGKADNVHSVSLRVENVDQQYAKNSAVGFTIIRMPAW